MQANGKSQGGGDVDKAKHRGRAYQCLRCFNQQGVSVIDVKQRIEEHIMKIHLSLDQVPFYCSLCLFRCRDRATLDDHVKNFSRHKQMVADRKCGNSSGFLKENPAPYRFSPEDYYVYSQEESVNIFIQKSLTKKGPQEIHADLVEQAVSDAFTTTGEGLNPTDANTAMTATGASNMGDPTSMLQLSSLLTKNLQETLLQSLLNLNQSANLLQNTSTPAATTTSASGDMSCQTPCQDEIDTPSHTIPLARTPDIGPLSFPTTPLCLSLSVDPQPISQPMMSVPSTPKPTTATLSTPKPAVSLPVPVQIMSKATLSAFKPVFQDVPTPQPTLPAVKSTWESQASTARTSRQRSPTPSLEMDPTEQVLDLSIKPSRGNLSTDSQPSADTEPAPAIPPLAHRVQHRRVEEECTALDLSIQPPQPDDTKEAGGQKEDILTQLLGDVEDHQLEDDIRLVKATSTPPHKSPLMSSPIITEHIRSTSPMRLKVKSAESAGTLIRAMENCNKQLMEEVERNSRSVRCLKKVVEDQAQDISAIKNLLENFVTYFRTNAREERRRQEKRDEERKNEREEHRRWESEKRKDEDRKRRIEEESQNSKRVKTTSNKENSPKIKSVLGKCTTENKKHKK